MGLKTFPKLNEPIYFTVMLNYEKRKIIPQPHPICLLSSPDSNDWFALIGIQLALFDQNGQLVPLRFEGRRKPVFTPYYRDGVPVLDFRIRKSDVDGNFTEIQWFISEQSLKCQIYSARLKIYLYKNNNYNPDDECLAIDHQQNYPVKCN